MLIIGAGGFAKEILEIQHQNNQLDNLCFYDDLNSDAPEKLYGKFRVLKDTMDAKEYFKNVDCHFALGIGDLTLRFALFQQFVELGGKIISTISQMAEIGHYGVSIGAGCNILGGVRISNDVRIGKGTMIYYNAIITHDVCIGDFCEVSPNAKLLGRCKIGNFVQIGTGAIVFPDVKVGDNAIIAAGAVVRTSVPENVMVAGMPAIIKKHKK